MAFKKKSGQNLLMRHYILLKVHPICIILLLRYFAFPSVPSSEIRIYPELFSYVIGYTVCNLTFVGAEEFKIVQIHFKFFKEYLAVENYC